MPEAPTIMNDFSSLMQIVKDLRGPDGCPWDKEQTHESLAPFAIEEVYEMVEALESQDDGHLKEELGDVLFQVALHCQLAEERGAFTHQEVIQWLNEKLIRRHPHVFANIKVQNIDEVWTRWEQIKKEEKLKKRNISDPKEISSSPFDFPKNLPALQRAHKIGLKSQKLKFDWSNANEVFFKVIEELDELKAEIAISNTSTPPGSNIESTARNIANIQEELGDLLFSIAQWARHLGLEPEQALRKANSKFENRFEKMMALVCERKLNWDTLTNTEKEALWQEIKIDF